MTEKRNGISMKKTLNVKHKRKMLLGAFMLAAALTGTAAMSGLPSYAAPAMEIASASDSVTEDDSAEYTTHRGCRSHTEETLLTLDYLKERRAALTNQSANNSTNQSTGDESSAAQSTVNGSSINSLANTKVIVRQNASADSKAAENTADAGTANLTDAGSETVSTDVTTIPLLVLVVGFNGSSEHLPDGISYNTEYDWSDTVFRADASLTQYYLEMSCGQFTFVPASETSAYGVGGNTNTKDTENDGVVHVTIDKAHGPWGDDTTESNVSMADALADAILAAEDYVDFSAYDTNKDGEISTDELALCIIAAGYEASSAPDLQSGDDRYLWAHAFTFLGLKYYYGWTGVLPKPDGIKVNSYIAMAETLKYQGKERQGILGTLSHELGHYLGLNDLYDTTGDKTAKEWSEYRVEDFSLMDCGGWGVDLNGEYIVYSMDVWSRTRMGWLTPVEVTESGLYDISAAEGSWTASYVPESLAGGTLTVTCTAPAEKTVLKVTVPDSNEYWLVENRSLTGRDEGMKKLLGYVGNKDADENIDIESGIVLWHIDGKVVEQYQTGNAINNYNHRPGVMPFYPEREESGIYVTRRQETGGTVDKRAFLTGKVLEEAFPELAEGFQLPRYGILSPDAKDERIDTCIWLSIPGAVSDASGDSDNETDIDSEVLKSNFMGGSVMTVSLDLVHHLPSETKYEKQTPPTTTAEGGYDKVIYCDRCGREVSREHIVIPKLPSGWQKSDGKWYYYDSEGELVTGWQKISGKWYWFNVSGVMQTGWRKLSGKWYYLNASGAMQTGWKKLGGVWYYFKPSGVMQTGWKKLGGKWYFFETSGAMRTGWKKLGGKWYFFDTSGAMVTGTRKIGGKTYQFDSSGVCLNP